MQTNEEEDLNSVREQLFSQVQSGSKKVLKIFLAIVLSLSITPFIFGGGWAVVNIGVMSYLGSKDPELLKSFQSMKINTTNNPASQKEFEKHPMVKESFARTSTILGLLIPLVIGSVFGLICRNWIFSLLPFGISLALNMNPLLNSELWLINSWIGLGMAVMILLLSSWFFSKIRFSSV